MMTVKTTTAASNGLHFGENSPLGPPSPPLAKSEASTKKQVSRLTFSVDSLLSTVSATSKQIDKIEVRQFEKFQI